jgi:hypothetical protein
MVWVWWHREKSAEKCTLAFAVLTKPTQVYLKVNGLVHSIGQIYVVNCASGLYRSGLKQCSGIRNTPRHPKETQINQRKVVNCLSQEVSALYYQHIDRRRT